MVYTVAPKTSSDVQHLALSHKQHDHENNPGDEDGEGTITKTFVSLVVCGAILLVYSGVGAWIFKVLEQDDDRSKIMHLRQIVAIERLILSTALVQLNNSCQCELEPSCTAGFANFNTALRKYEIALDEVSDGALTLYINDNDNPKGRWSYFHSLLFVFTLITTIGYGNLTPKTTTGRVFCIMFALLGIPLALIEIALAGKFLAKMFTKVFLRIFRRFFRLDLPRIDVKSSTFKKMLGTTLSVAGVLNLLLCYNTIGAFLYDYTEDWGWINSFYFCFTTLTTVGFGDLVPTAGVASGNPFASVRVLYVLFGLALTSTSFELVRVQYAKVWAKQPLTTPALFVPVQRSTINHKHSTEKNGNITTQKSGFIPQYEYLQ